MESYPSKARTYFARWALLPTGWQRDVRIEVRTDGTFGHIQAGHDPATTETIDQRVGTVICGMVNLHSHAFQRAMAGLTERGGPSTDSFWTWREVMYRFLAELSPDDVEAIAAQLYVELLKGGFTGIVEFHYLHRDPSGALYQNPAELAQRIVSAAEHSGIGLTLLVSLYQQGGFAAAALQPRQQRFYLSDDEFAQILTELHHRRPPGVQVGIAPHSLRAVTPDALHRAITLQTQLAPRAPIHLHIAEQPAEVSDCLSWSQRRPMDWLMDECSVDERFCLIHATHGQPAELVRVAERGAVIGLCPSTEANLGDGIFAATDYQAAGGRFGIGTDSHVGTSALDELRLLEYSQRLRHGRRNVLSPGEGVSTGTYLWQQAAQGGAQAAAQPTGVLQPGARADLVVLDEADPSLYGRSGAALLDSAVFGPGRQVISDVMCAGRWVVRDRRHFAEDAISARFAEVMRRLAR